MKKVAILTAFAFAGIAANAQKEGTDNGRNLYVIGGVNFANITKDAQGTTDENKYRTSFNAGILTRFGVSNVFDFETGLLLNGKGSKYNVYMDNNNRNDNYVKSSFNTYYLELPVNAVVKLPTGSSNVFLHAGPYAAAGLWGKNKTETKILGVTTTTSNDIKFNNENPVTGNNGSPALDKLKRFDYGFNFGGGFTVSNVLIRANYGLGLAKINSTQTNNSQDKANKNRVWSLSVGIPLGM